MADYSLLGLFHEAEPTADAIQRLRGLGIPDERITIMSGMPYRAEILGRPRPKVRVGLIAVVGALLGLVTGAFLSVGIFLLYPLVQGGQPVVPVPPTLIILFELTMLGTMWATFFGLLGLNRFPVFKSEIYDPRITEGHIGVEVDVDEDLIDPAEGILVENGAHHLYREKVSQRTDVLLTVFWTDVGLIIGLLAVIVTLIAYDILNINFPTNMANQESIAYVEGPRLAAPPLAVPVQGPALIAGMPASEPLPASADSLQRGQVLFSLNCVMCHGPGGQGNGLLSGFFKPKPADLTSNRVQGLADQEIFLIITQGFNVMPSIAENLSPAERWDVINHVRTLKK